MSWRAAALQQLSVPPPLCASSVAGMAPVWHALPFRQAPHLPEPPLCAPSPACPPPLPACPARLPACLQGGGGEPAGVHSRHLLRQQLLILRSSPDAQAALAVKELDAAPFGQQRAPVRAATPAAPGRLFHLPTPVSPTFAAQSSAPLFTPSRSLPPISPSAPLCSPRSPPALLPCPLPASTCAP